MVRSATTLTDRQQRVLDLIHQVVQETGVPPTRAEIAQRLGFRSANAAEDHLQALARKGVIDLVGGVSRGIRLKALPRLAGLGDSLSSAFESLALPLIGRVAAGSPILAEAHQDGTFQVGRGLFEETPDYLLRVRGLSMRDAGIFDGDLLAVRATQDVRNGQIVVARLGDEVTVKRLLRLRDSIELHPENPDFSTILVRPGDPFVIEGRAVGLIRNQPHW